MSMTNPATGPLLVSPEIDASDLKAARDFLLAFRDERPTSSPSISSPSTSARPRPFPRHGERKTPTVSNGIARARSRASSNAKPGA